MTAHQRPLIKESIMKAILQSLVVIWLVVSAASESTAQSNRAYRLASVDIKQRVIWGAECLEPPGSGLAFGGQDQQAEDGRPHTRMLIDGQWRSIHDELPKQSRLDKLHAQIWALRNQTKDCLAKARAIYFKGLTAEAESERIREHVAPSLNELGAAIDMLVADLPIDLEDLYAQDQVCAAGLYLQHTRKRLPSFGQSVTAEALQSLNAAQIQLELATETLAAEPPPRAANCGGARLPDRQTGPTGRTLIYDAKTKLYVLFGGDHLDYLTNDTWVFDPAKRRWFQRHPQGAPPPRANHRLTADGDGVIRLQGGYTYTSSTDYVGSQYIDLEDGPWTYDIEKNEWSGGDLTAPDTRVYRTGALHPEFYFQDAKPNAAEFEQWLTQIPENEWVATNPLHRPQLNRDWGTARIDPDRDMILRWSGGHSAHGGTDVLHFHFSTNRWELPIPVEFPLGQLYSNTSYPNGYNFNLRPWMTGHTYQNYAYDPPSKTMVKAGRPRHYYVYDPDRADWVSRGGKPAAMRYNSCFYDLTLAATPHGAISWGKNAAVHRYDHGAGEWVRLELTGDELPGSYVDNSSMVYDSTRDRLLILDTNGYKKPFDGGVWEVDLKTLQVKKLTPQGSDKAVGFSAVDKSCYDAEHDLVLLGAYLKESGDLAPIPAYDCRNNRWVTLKIKYATGERYGNTTRAFPHTRSDGLMYDARRKLLWGTETRGQVYVLRLNPEKAEMTPLK